MIVSPEYMIAKFFLSDLSNATSRVLYIPDFNFTAKSAIKDHVTSVLNVLKRTSVFVILLF